MPRQPRLVQPDLPVHIVQRGHNRQRCFTQDGDHLVYLALLQEAAQRFGCAVHAYCLMSNHVHLLLTPGSMEACAALMHRVAQRYAYYFNRAQQRTGTLWEGRFKSCIVESSAYVLACYRYIELNPVRAGIVSHPEAYPWSSFAGNSGSRNDALLAPHAEFSALSRAEYLALIEGGLDAQSLREIREATIGGYPLATDRFKSALGQASGRRVAPGRAGRPARKAEEGGKSEPVPDLLSGDGVS
jgi:putative transposase